MENVIRSDFCIIRIFIGRILFVLSLYFSLFIMRIYVLGVIVRKYVRDVGFGFS